MTLIELLEKLENKKWDGAKEETQRVIFGITVALAR
jgi:hypothetical protein